MEAFFFKTLKKIKVRQKYFQFLTGFIIGAGLKETLDYFQERINAVEPQDEVDGLIKESTAFDEVDGNSIGIHAMVKYGLPISPATLEYSNHAVHYDAAKKIPAWVAQHITRHQLYGEADRQTLNFKSDKNLPEKFRSTNEDFLDSGYTRGHMSPAADSKSSQKSMQETFFLSNIVPQNLDNNAGFWYRMETYCRSLAKRYTNVHVVSGPLFLPTYDETLVKYKLIGENKVAVPTHLYKVILVEDKNKPKAIGAFVVPNQPIPAKKNLQDYQVNLEELEKHTGYEFFPKLDKSSRSIRDICVVDGCKMIKQATVEMYNVSRSFKKARTIEELDVLWKKGESKGMEVDQQIIDEYWKKKLELKKKLLN